MYSNFKTESTKLSKRKFYGAIFDLFGMVRLGSTSLTNRTNLTNQKPGFPGLRRLPRLHSCLARFGSTTLTNLTKQEQLLPSLPLQSLAQNLFTTQCFYKKKHHNLNIHQTNVSVNRNLTFFYNFFLIFLYQKNNIYCTLIVILFI